MKSKSHDILTVPIKVNPVLREYIISINGGSDILYPDYQGDLWVIIKSKLQLIPPDYAPVPPGVIPGFIRVALPGNNHLKPAFNIQADRIIEANTIFRCHLDAVSQRQVEHFLMKGFKKTFRDFMTGAVTCNNNIVIKNAIDQFCGIFNLPMESITYEMLRKDWYRYKTRDSRGDPAPQIKDNFK